MNAEQMVGLEGPHAAGVGQPGHQPALGHKLVTVLVLVIVLVLGPNQILISIVVIPRYDLYSIRILIITN